VPFGPDCEFADQAACERANQDRDDPAAYCAALRRRTEEHCMGNRDLRDLRAVGVVPFDALAAPAAGSIPPSPTGFVDPGRPPRLRLARPLARQARSWYRITAKAAEADPEGDGEGAPKVDGDTTIIDIYDEVGWFGTGAADFIRDLRQVDTPKIELHINSPGGDVFDAIAIFNALRQHKAHVHVLVDSLAASAASFIAMAGDKVTAMANAMLMIHDPWGLVIGNAADMREMAGLLDKHGDNIASIYAAHAGGEIADWRERMLAETWYLADEAYKAGLVDEVADADGRPIEDAWDLSVFAHRPEQTRPAASAAAVSVGATAPPTHHTATVDGTWDAGPNEKRLPSPMPVATAKKAYGYYDGAQVIDGTLTKEACKLLHHQVSEDGTPGAAHLAGVRNALSRLPQSTTPESEHPAIQRHLNAHLEDAPEDASTTQAPEASNGRVPAPLGAIPSWFVPSSPRKETPQWQMP
jgi:ATP-dependent Clp endopeptidase proteolytic subunit ClpP